MLGRHTTVLVTMTSTLPNVLFVRINGWKLVGVFCCRRGKIREVRSAMLDCRLVI